ncbi:MAG TPA: hypothetical protein VGM51_05235 [Armatimonadota bacterium]|jgi:hypothetical protein
MKHGTRYLGIGLALALSAAPLFAAAHTYNTKVQTIRCGVLLANRYAWADGRAITSTAADGAHPFSYVFHALNARPDIRPYSWEIVNPYAAPFMDGIMAARYGLTINPSNPPRLNKNMGAYWEVYLHEVTAEQLANYDVLYIPLPYNDSTTDTLTVDDREKLRRAVDAGLTLWYDNATGGSMNPETLDEDLIGVGFMAGGRGRPAGDPLNALLSTPNPLSAREIAQLGLNRGGASISLNNALTQTISPGAPLPWTVVSAIADRPVIAATTYGQGAIVVTSRAFGRELTQGFRAVPGVDDVTTGAGWRGANTGPASGSDASRVPAPELKFLINLISYRFQSPQPGGGARHASGSRQDLNTPLGRKWQYPENFKLDSASGKYKVATVPFVSDPVVWNGICYAATSDGFLRAYDMDPDRDLDGDGNPDDGLQNPLTPSSDRIWEVPLPGPCSSLVIGDFGNRPRLYGMLANGSVFAADALPRTANGRLKPTTTIQSVRVNGFGTFPPLLGANLPSSATDYPPGEKATYRIPAPVWYNGRLFVVGVRASPSADLGVGALAEIDPVTLQTRWQYPDITAGTAAGVRVTRLGIPSATPTVAAIPDKGYSGATDIMLLVPSLSIKASSGYGPAQASRVTAFPIGVRGEKLLYNGDSNNRKFWTRFSRDNSIPAVNVTVWVGSSGVPVIGTMAVDTANNRNRMYIDAPVPVGLENDLRADYDFAPQAPVAPFAGYNPRWTYDAWSYVVGDINKFMEILTTPVVSSAGGMYWVASDVGQGANQAPIVMGVEMRQQNLGFTVTGNPNYQPPLNSPQLTFVYSVGSASYVSGGCASAPPTPQPVVLGTPAVDRGILYVANGHWRDPVTSTGGVDGFYVQNTKFGLLLNSPIDPSQKGSVSILQRNLCTGDLQQVGYGLFDVDNTNIGNVLRGLITFRTLSSGSGSGAIDFSRPGDMQVNYQALDVTTGKAVAVQSETPTVYYKSERGEGSDPTNLLAFSAAVPVGAGGGVRTGVTVAGGSIYVGSDSGDIWTVPLPTSLDVVRRLTTRKMLRATYPSLAASAGFSISTYPNPSVDPRAPLRSTPIVANGTLIENAPVGLYSFYSPRTLITDSTRIIEVASTYAPVGGLVEFSPTGSEIIWSLDSTVQNREFGSPGVGAQHPPWAEGRLDPPVSKALNQPTMAVRINSTNTLVCDTGNNRVVEVDRTGNIVWQCTEFADPYGLLGANESRALSSPTSAQRWETYEWDANDNVGARAQHTLITDFGNNRILEIVSRFSPDDADQANNVLVWAGRGPAGKGYQFFQAQREAYYKPNDPNNGSLDYGRTIASVINYAVNSAEVQSDDSALSGAVTGLPATAGGSLVLLGGKSETYGGGAKSAAGKVVYFLSKAHYDSDPTKGFPLARPVYFNRYVTGDGAFDWRVTMTDGNNIFDLTKRPADPAGLATILTTFPNGPIVANIPLGTITNGLMGSGGHTTGTSMAKRLQNGNVLMVNQKTGRVFEYSPKAALAGDLQSILSQTAPSIEGTGALNRPVYADRLF